MSTSIRFNNANGETDLAAGTIYSHGLSSAATVAATSTSTCAVVAEPDQKARRVAYQEFFMSSFTEARIQCRAQREEKVA